MKTNKYYIHWNGAAWFVKEEQFFIDQGGKNSKWGKHWHLIEANSIEDARKKAEKLMSKSI